MTMKIAQNLYEAGYITYMRTDSMTYSKEFVDKTKKLITDKYGDNYINKKINTLITNSKKETKKRKKIIMPKKHMRQSSYQNRQI